MMEHNENTKSEFLYGNDCPYIDMQWKKGVFFLSNAVFRLIKKPTGIRLLWNEAKCTLLIEPTSKDDPDGFPVFGPTYSRSGSLYIGSVTLITKIWETNNWDTSLRYRAVAKYNEASNVAIFELKDALGFEIPKNIRGGRRKYSLNKNLL